MNADGTEQNITYFLLQVISEGEEITQRTISKKMGLALGVVNKYIKRCVKKGLVKIEQSSTNHYLYLLTPKGFYEKSILASRYIRASLEYYSLIKRETVMIIDSMVKLDLMSIAIIGSNEITEIAQLYLNNAGIRFQVVAGVPYDFDSFDAVLIVEPYNINKYYKTLTTLYFEKKIFAYSVCGV